MGGMVTANSRPRRRRRMRCLQRRRSHAPVLLRSYVDGICDPMWMAFRVAWMPEDGSPSACLLRINICACFYNSSGESCVDHYMCRCSLRDSGPLFPYSSLTSHRLGLHPFLCAAAPLGIFGEGPQQADERLPMPVTHALPAPAQTRGPVLLRLLLCCFCVLFYIWFKHHIVYDDNMVEEPNFRKLVRAARR